MIVYLWDAPGPERRGCGVSGNEAAARRAAEACLRSGHASGARVEAAYALLGMRMMTSGYQRTGEGSRAVRGPRGSIRWVPLAVQPSRGETNEPRSRTV